jgi:hypothetical protein
VVVALLGTEFVRVEAVIVVGAIWWWWWCLRWFVVVMVVGLGVVVVGYW